MSSGEEKIQELIKRLKRLRSKQEVFEKRIKQVEESLKSLEQEE